MTHTIDIPRSVDLFAHLRAMVEQGCEDGAVRVLHDGKHCLNVASLYRGALLTAVEEPRVHLARYTPHPKATVGPRVQALLDARAAADAA